MFDTGVVEKNTNIVMLSVSDSSSLILLMVIELSGVQFDLKS